MEEKPKTRPGRNGGTLKNDAGPGRPKGKKNLTTILAGELSKNSWKKAHMLVDAVIMQAARGNGTAIKLIWDHTVGPVTEKHELSGPDGGPIQFESALERFYGSNRKVPTDG